MKQLNLISFSAVLLLSVLFSHLTFSRELTPDQVTAIIDDGKPGNVTYDEADAVLNGKVYIGNITPIYDEIFLSDYKKEFFTKVCGIKLTKSTSAKDLRISQCNSKLLEAYAARLIEEYGPETIGKAELWCKGHPIECHEVKGLEARAKQTQDTIESDQRAAQIEKARQEKKNLIPKIIKAFIKAGAERKCSSEPNADGGYDTYCY